MATKKKVKATVKAAVDEFARVFLHLDFEDSYEALALGFAELLELEVVDDPPIEERLKKFVKRVKAEF